jgi:hypothetical protein
MGSLYHYFVSLKDLPLVLMRLGRDGVEQCTSIESGDIISSIANFWCRRLWVYVRIAGCLSAPNRYPFSNDAHKFMLFE